MQRLAALQSQTYDIHNIYIYTHTYIYTHRHVAHKYIQIHISYTEHLRYTYSIYRYTYRHSADQRVVLLKVLEGISSSLRYYKVLVAA